MPTRPAHNDGVDMDASEKESILQQLPFLMDALNRGLNVLFSVRSRGGWGVILNHAGCSTVARNEKQENDTTFK